MSYTLRPAQRTEAKPLIGLYSESGCGKTWSSLLLARGFAGTAGAIAMIETEAGRGEAYADLLPGGYQVCALRGSFAPSAYAEALTAVEAAGASVLIIDSASHEWEGAGGVLSMAADNEAAGKKAMMIWQKPKLEHQRHFMLRLLATPIPLVIVCMRAKYPMKEVRRDGAREWVRAEVVEPIQSSDILYELFVHGWIDRAHRFQPTKYTREELSQVLRPGEPISIETGERLADWAKALGSAPLRSAASGAAERAALLAQIAEEKAKLSRAPTESQWRAIHRAKCGTPGLEDADPASLHDLLGWLQRLTAKELSAVTEARQIVVRATLGAG